MLRNYLATALRNLARNKFTAAINILGLGIGLASALIALLFVRHELTHDRFIPGYERVYVMTYEQTLAGSRRMITDRTPVYFARWVEEDFPGVRAARLKPDDRSVRRGDMEAIEQVAWTDPDFFTLLPLPVLAGDLPRALDAPDAVVITRAMARKYFGRNEPIGELLEIGRKESLRVTAVIADLPAATHLTPQIYASARNRAFGLQEVDDAPYQMSGSTPVYTYLTLPPSGLSASDLQRAMPDFVQRRMGDLLSFIEATLAVQLVPLAQLHLAPNDMQAMKPHVDLKIVMAIGAAGVMILLVAVVNFVNLTSARVLRRAVEAGVRKVSGAEARDLRLQFMGEAMVYAVLGLLLAAALSTVVLPPLDALIPGMREHGLTPAILVTALVLKLLCGLLGGAYPGYLVSTFRPAAVLKGTLTRAGKSNIRQALVGLQFAILIALIFSTLVIYRQSIFNLRDGLRFSGEGMLLVYSRCDANLAAALREAPGVRGVACSNRDPFNMPAAFTQGRRADGTTLSLGIGGVGFGYFELFGIAPLAGRFYDEARDAAALEDSRAPLAVINETAVRALGFASPGDAVGRTVSTIQNQDGPPSQIIGVVPDYTFDTREAIHPTVYWPSRGNDPLWSVLNVKVSGENIAETFAAIDGAWARLGDPRPIKRMFLDQSLQARYVGITRQQTLITAAAFTATLVACFGLFGLAAFTAEQRTKEIGIRKSMGASRTDILRLILWQFARPILWANVVAWPLAYVLMARWLEGFAYHIDLAPWMFLGASALALVIAMATVIGHALIVARAKPIAALRYE